VRELRLRIFRVFQTSPALGEVFVDIDVLGASRAGKPANSPVGAISRRRGSLMKARAVFYFTRPTRDAAPFYTPVKFNTPCCDAAVLFYIPLLHFNYPNRSLPA
jgi:hypothetical protein